MVRTFGASDTTRRYKPDVECQQYFSINLCHVCEFHVPNAIQQHIKQPYIGFANKMAPGVCECILQAKYESKTFHTLSFREKGG